MDYGKSIFQPLTYTLLNCPSVFSGLWSLLAVGIFLFGEQAKCSLHSTFEGLCYCSFRLPPLVSITYYIYIYIACYYVVAMCYISRTGSYRPVYNFPVS